MRLISSPSKYGPTKVFLTLHFSSKIRTFLGRTGHRKRINKNDYAVSTVRISSPMISRLRKLLLEGASLKSTRHLKVILEC